MTDSKAAAALDISDRAVRRIAELMAQPEHKGLTLRLAVNGGGCSGFAYGFSFDNQANADDVIIEKGGVRLLVDEISLDYLRGAQLDYVDEMIGAAFTVRNPNAASSCGCGNSFSVA